MERYVLKVQVRAAVVSFRRATEMNYQRSYPLPPPTTLLGVAGAALGLDERELWSDTGPLAPLKVAVLAENAPAVAIDLWTLRKMDLDRGTLKRAPYYRECLFGVRYALLYAHPDDGLLDRLGSALQDPVFALCLGRADDLAVVESVERVPLARAAVHQAIFHGTILPVAPQAIRLAAPVRTGLRSQPITSDRLPVRFVLDRHGRRAPHAWKPLSFVPYGLEVRADVRTVYRLEERYFTWINS